MIYAIGKSIDENLALLHKGFNLTGAYNRVCSSLLQIQQSEASHDQKRYTSELAKPLK